jgi:hypothetical protein
VHVVAVAQLESSWLWSRRSPVRVRSSTLSETALWRGFRRLRQMLLSHRGQFEITGLQNRRFQVRVLAVPFELPGSVGAFPLGGETAELVMNAYTSRSYMTGATCVIARRIAGSGCRVGRKRL